MRKILTLFIALFFLTSTQAQLADGSYAPNFTGVDINGNTWELYDLLDQGKSVIIDVSATWCGPCWSYHESGELETVYDTYGPNGTEEMMVLWIEGDPTTGMDDILGTTASSQGDWTAGTGFPIIDDNSIAELYEITYYPTIYHICQNRTVREAGQISAADLYAMNADCEVAAGVNNVGLLVYEGFEGDFCQSLTFEPAAFFQNLGTSNVTAAEFQLSVDGTVTETINWTGDISTYQAETITFSSITVNQTTDLSIDVLSVNANTDEDPGNNLISTQVVLAPSTNDNLATLTIITDNYPTETYWELLDGNGTALYTGGNSGIFSGTTSPDAYTTVGGTYEQQLALPADGCFDFVIRDAFGDGICCDYGSGSYTITDQMGNVIAQGGEFENIETKPFEVSGGTGIFNNGGLVNYTGVDGDFCTEISFDPVVSVQNVGANDITSMDIEARDGATVLQSFNWTGTLAPASAANVTMNTITLSQTTDVTFHIINVNGVADAYDSNNEYGAVSFIRAANANEMLTFEITTDPWGCEIYWEFINTDNGTIAASGGNPDAVAGSGAIYLANGGCDGQPGYANETTVTETFSIPVDACYEFKIIDDYGDGLTAGGYTLTDADGNVLISEPAGGFAERANLFEGKSAVAVENIESAEAWNIFPNPAQDIIRLEFTLTEQLPLQVELYNTLGKQIQTIANENFAMGVHSLSADVSLLPNGMYYINVISGGQTTTHKFVISK